MNSNPQPAVTMAPIALSVPQAIAMTNLSRPHIYRSIRDGSLKTMKIGRRRLIRPDDLNAWMAAQAAAA